MLGLKEKRNKLLEEKRFTRKVYLLLGVVIWMTSPSFLKILTSSNPFNGLIPIFFRTVPSFLSSVGM
jgi:hypothetical protein